MYAFHDAEDGSDKKVFLPAERNGQPILEVLTRFLDSKTPGLQFLEISSGTGQHALYFANQFPNITFQPTEYDEELLASIAAYADESRHGNMKQPLFVDISQPCLLNFAGQFDYILNVNLIHVSPWACTEGLFRTAGHVLKPGGLLLTYGALAIDGVLEPESNREFDEALRKHDPEWGIRDLRDLKQEAAKNGIVVKEVIDMPSNNKMVVWQKNEQ
ncbi:unnamed protein product [Hermetia illucens]|uniref:Uncharacterized protein n=1 Tax=Hermetia illucens TaxID=343691 RepID=A0A7R8V008_HERIL|nr:UPF0585 protein CG18661-like [Hermetia illucens]CAD7089094.1 unnamed protein product [Hermetia illucens]